MGLLRAVGWAMVWWAGACAAQGPVLHRLDESNGLANNNVFDLFIDREGLLWISSERGLYRYDGFTHHQVATPTALGGRMVMNMVQGPAGEVWLATTALGLYRWQDGVLQEFPIKHDSLQVKATFGRWVDMAVDTAGHLHLASESAPGHWVLDPNTGTATRQPLPAVARMEVHTVAGVPLLVTWGMLRGDTIQLLDLRVPGRKPVPILREGALLTLRRHGQAVGDDHGAVWWTLGSIVFRLGADGTLHKRDLGTEALGCTLDRTHGMWVRLNMDRVVCLDTLLNECPVHLDGLDGMHATDMVVVHGGLWIGAVGHGLFYCPSLAVTTYDARRVFGAARLTALATDPEGGLLVGTHHREMFHLDDGGRITDRLTLPGSWPEGDVKGIVPLGDGRIFIACPSPAFMLENGGLRELPDQGIGTYAYDAVALGPDTLLFASAYGLYWQLRPDSGTLLLRGTRVFDLERGTGDTLWASTTAGLYAWCRGALLHHGAPLHFADTNVLCTKVRGDTLWAGTTTGLWRRVQGTWARVMPGPERGEMSVNTLVFADARTLWLGTDQGIFRLRAEADGFTWRHFGKGAGLPSESIRTLVLAAGKVWAIAGNDLVTFDPDEVLAAAAPHTPFGAAQLILADDALPLVPGLEVPYTGAAMAIALRNVNFGRFQRPAFRYRLNGGATWTALEQPRIELFGLAPGAYHLVVQAAGADGTWGPAEHLAWTVVPRFWQTAWAKGLFYILIGGCITAVFFGMRARRRGVERLRNEALAYQQQALVAQIEPHFVFNALNSIQGFIAGNDAATSTRYLARFSRLMRGLLEASERGLVPLDEEVDLLENYCSLEALRYRGAFTFTIVTDAALDPQHTLLPAFLLQPYVENAIRHGLRGLQGSRPGTLAIRFTLEAPGALLCVIEDNGVGRAAAMTDREGPRPLGTRISQERVRLLNEVARTGPYRVDTIDLYDEEKRPRGTRVELRCPIGKSRVPRTKTNSDDERSGGG